MVAQGVTACCKKNKCKNKENECSVEGILVLFLFVYVCLRRKGDCYTVRLRRTRAKVTQNHHDKKGWGPGAPVQYCITVAGTNYDVVGGPDGSIEFCFKRGSTSTSTPSSVCTREEVGFIASTAVC